MDNSEKLMLNKTSLATYGWFSLLMGLVSVETPLACMFFSFLGVLLLTISMCIKPQELKVTVRGLFRNHAVTNELEAIFNADPKFNEALEYVRSLSPEDFLRFVRVSVEVRGKSDQNVLRDVGRLFGRKK